MVEAPGDHVGTSAHHRLQRLGSAGKIEDLHVETFVLEVAQALRQSQRQIEQPGFSADRDRDFRFLWRSLQGTRRQAKTDSEPQQQRKPHASCELSWYQG